ncbi:MAG: hypothetical protein E7098_06645 [Mediterranea massiliensis]|nr:hypothetical protein [Mediterranea massiliensis]
MIKQDYLLRMIQEIIALIVQALLNKRKIAKSSWTEYDNLTTQLLGLPSNDLSQLDADAIIARYQGDADSWGKCELAAMTLLKMSDEMSNEQLVEKSRAKQNGIALLEYVQANSPNFSLQRSQLLQLLKSGQQ